MNLVNAEVAKIAVNTYVTTKISYANMLSELCEQLPGGDANVVTDAIGLDTRIGPRFFKAALGYGGPCFPRDNAAFLAVSRVRGVEGDIAAATDAINRRQVSRLAATVKAQLAGADRRVAVLGLSYKPDTDVVEESQGVLLANRLASDGYNVTVFDPVALDSAATFLTPSVHTSATLAGCLAAADVIVLTVAWPQFREIPVAIAALPPRRRVIVDCWRIIDRARLDATTDVVHPGVDQTRRSAVAAGSVQNNDR
jgi:UDPglucose 6-dehydrogenase